MSVKGMELRLHEHGGFPPPGLNSARAAAACRSVRDAILQVSLRLQGCQSAVAGKGIQRVSGCEAEQVACIAGCWQPAGARQQHALAAWQRCWVPPAPSSSGQHLNRISAMMPGATTPLLAAPTKAGAVTPRPGSAHIIAVSGSLGRHGEWGWCAAGGGAVGGGGGERKQRKKEVRGQ